jgi:hypothetical protein
MPRGACWKLRTANPRLPLDTLMISGLGRSLPRQSAVPAPTANQATTNILDWHSPSFDVGRQAHRNPKSNPARSVLNSETIQ